MPPSRTPPELSIILPAWQEGAFITASLRMVLGLVEEQGWNAEVILVDDGSPDNTSEAARSLCDPRVRVLRHIKNGGKGAAVRTGMLAARGGKRIFTDSDIPYRFEDMVAAVRALDEVPVVIGDRNLAESQYRQSIPLPRRVASYCFDQFTSLVLTSGIHDTQCGLKGFTAEAAKTIFLRATFDHFGFDVEAIHIALLNGYEIKRIPVVLQRNNKSSVRIVRDSLLMIRDILRLKWNDWTGVYTRPLADSDPDIWQRRAVDQSAADQEPVPPSLPAPDAESDAVPAAVLDADAAPEEDSPSTSEVGDGARQ